MAATPALRGPTQDLESERQEAVAVLVTSLDELVDWSTKNKLFAERDKIFEQILDLDPENFQAHKGLGHSRLRDGSLGVRAGGASNPRTTTRRLSRSSRPNVGG